MQSVTEPGAAWPVLCRSAAARLLAGAALLCIFASANADQLLVTAANSDGNKVFDLNLSQSSAPPPAPVTPVIASTTTPINTDGANHGSFDALVWVSNSYCKTLDLIVADAAKGQIVRYAGASTVTNCYNPTNGTPTVNPTAQLIFNWTKLSPGPARPNGLSADANGNLFVVSSSGLFDPKPSVWVLPFNQSANLYCIGAAGVYCAPVLIDSKFSGQWTLALADTLVASTTTPLWKAGDLLVLVGDSFAARLTVYSQSTLYAANGLINTGHLNLSGPHSIAIPFTKFLQLFAAPFGMDLWPANTKLGTNTSVLFTTIDGRILRFDTVQNKFVTNFASGLGFGLQKLKVGTYANAPYAFVAQVGPRGTGQILAFAAPPAGGANKPLAAVSMGVMEPVGLAVSNSGSVPVPTGCTSCSVSPLGPVAITYFTPPPNSNFTGSITEQICTVDPDPRTSATIVNGVLTSWSCAALGTPTPALPIGSGTSYCPTFPFAIIPGSVCGHSGPDARGLAVIEGTALGLDRVDNNTFFATPLNIDAVLPGPGNLECANFPTTGKIPLTAWGTRSDLPTVEGTIAEDSLIGFPFLAGAPGYVAESTTACDTSSTGSHGISIFAFGLGLSNTSPSYVYALQNEKSAALLQTVETANITGVDQNNIPVQTQLENDINTVAQYVSAGQVASLGRTNGPPTAKETANIDCALNEIGASNATDQEVRENLGAFNGSIPLGTGDTDPAGAIDSGLANWYLTLNTEILLNAAATLPPPPYAYPLPFPVPPAAVPLCQGQPQLYSVTATVTGLTGSGLQLQDSFNNSALSFSGTDPVVAANSNGNYTFPTVLASGTTYNVTVPNQPTGQTCTVTGGTGNVTNANVTVSVSCAATSTQPQITSFTAPASAANDNVIANWTSVNTTSCTMTTLYAFNTDDTGYNFVSASGFPTGGPGFGGYDIYYIIPDSDDEQMSAPQFATPGWGTDTYTLTCYGAAGTTPATASILNTSGFTPPPATPLTISSFTSDLNGDLAWTTTHSTTSTTCTITDEFGGTPYNQPPVGGLPGTGSTYDPYFFYFGGAFCPTDESIPQLNTDTITLTCSDKANGTAISTLTLNSPGCGE